MPRSRTRDFLGFALVAGLLFGLLGGPLGAQETGTVSGSVTNAMTLRPIPGVQVFIAGSGIGNIAGANGRYLLLNVPVGEHTGHRT
jgi:hypothetical protein